MLFRSNAELSAQLKIKSNDGVLLTDNTGTQNNFQMAINNNNVQLQSLIRGYGFIITTLPDNAGGATQTVLKVDQTTGLITVLNDPTDPQGVATKNYVDNRDNATRTMLQSNVASLYSNIAQNVFANLLVTTGSYVSSYGNIRQIQADLGYNPSVGGVLQSTPIANYQAVVAGGGTFATNITNLWTNVAAFYTNTLGGVGKTGSGGDVNSSMYANVISLQGRTTSVENNYLTRNGGLSILGTLAPDVGSRYALGQSGKTFANIWVDTVITSGSVLNLQTINGTGSTRSKFDPMQIICNPLTVTGNIVFNDNINGNPTSNAALGIASPLRVTGALSHTADIIPVSNETQNLGSSPSLRYNNVYAKTINAAALNLSGSTQSSSAASFGAITTSGDFLPASDLAYKIGSSTARWTAVFATSLTSDNGVSIGSNGIRLNTGTAQDIGTSSNPFATLYAGQWTGSTFYTSTSKLGIQNGAVVNLADATNYFQNGYINTLYGTATQAKYSDLAERYASDAHYPPGTVIKIGGAYEITQETDELSEDVFGVISSNPAHLMNEAAGTNATHPPVALSGRVPVLVKGPVTKGQRLVSAGDGKARAAAEGEYNHFNVLGRALADKYEDNIALVECVVFARI